MKKWLARIAIAVAVLLLLLVVLVAGLTSTQSGTRWLLAKGVQLSGQDVQLQNISGSLWSGLAVGDIQFENCGVKLSVKNLQFDWQPRLLLQKSLVVNGLSADAIDVTPKTECEPEPKEPFVLPEQIQLPLSIDVDRLYVKQLSIHNDTGTQSLENVELQANVGLQQATLALKSLSYTSFSLQAQTTVQLQQPYPLQGLANWKYLLDAQQFQGNVQFEGDTQKLALTHDLQSPYQIQTQANLFEPLAALRFESNTEWQKITIELNETESITLREGKLQANGEPTQINYDLATQLDTSQVQNIDVQAKGLFANNQVTLQPAQIQHADAILKAQGAIGFAENLAVQLEVTAKDLDPSLWLVDYPGNLAANVVVDYQQLPAANRLNLHIKQLQGKLRGYPLKGSGHVTSDLKQAKLDQVKLSVGDNSLRANGLIGDTINIQAELNAPRIEQLLAQASGDVSGSVNLQGTLEKPQLQAQLASKQFQYADQLNWQQLDLQANVKGLENPAINTELKLQSLQIAGQTLTDSQLSLQGSENAHQLKLSTNSSHGALNLQAQGSLQREPMLWQGQLTSVQLNKTIAGDWSTTQPANVTAGPEQQQLEQFCLKQGQQEICADYSRTEDQQQSLQADLQQFDFKLLQPFIQEFANITGSLSGKVNLAAAADGIWAGNAQLATQGFSLTSAASTGVEETITFDRFQIEALLDDSSRLQAQFQSNRGTGDIDLRINSLQQTDKAEITQGLIRINIPELTFLNPYLQGAVIRKGQVDVNLQLSGALQKPDLRGQAEIEQLGFYLPDLGSEIHDAKFTIKANEYSRLQFDGVLFSKEAQMKLDGELSLQESDFLHYQVNIKGKQFPILDTVDYVADISPDLNLQGNSERLKVNGTVGVPRLHIIIKELPKGVDSVSSDQVIVSPEGEAVQQDAFVVVGDIGIKIGDDALFTGYGLQTELGGNLKVSLREKKPPAGFGVLSMKNGQYRALGQALEIDKGDILFSGPLDNPSLDVRIKRTIDDVSVSLLVSGRADDPQSRLISDPVMSEANKLSYLLTGRPVDALGSGEGTDLTAAAFALGLNKSSSVVQEIGTKFGLDTLSVQAGDDGMQSTSLLLGKHLSPRLYISYAKDLFSALGAIQLNYGLTDHISIEATSGTAQTVDLIYSIATD